MGPSNIDPQIFANEFLREMRAKGDLIKKAEAIRQTDNLKYSKVIEKHEAKYKRLNLLSIKQLEILVEELVSA